MALCSIHYFLKIPYLPNVLFLPLDIFFLICFHRSFLKTFSEKNVEQPIVVIFEDIEQKIIEHLIGCDYNEAKNFEEKCFLILFVFFSISFALIIFVHFSYM